MISHKYYYFATLFIKLQEKMQKKIERSEKITVFLVLHEKTRRINGGAPGFYGARKKEQRVAAPGRIIWFGTETACSRAATRRAPGAAREWSSRPGA